MGWQRGALERELPEVRALRNTSAVGGGVGGGPGAGGILGALEKPFAKLSRLFGSFADVEAHMRDRHEAAKDAYREAVVRHAANPDGLTERLVEETEEAVRRTGKVEQNGWFGLFKGKTQSWKTMIGEGTFNGRTDDD